MRGLLGLCAKQDLPLDRRRSVRYSSRSRKVKKTDRFRELYKQVQIALSVWCALRVGAKDADIFHSKLFVQKRSLACEGLLYLFKVLHNLLNYTPKARLI